jgi:hypothetical protein
MIDIQMSRIGLASTSFPLVIGILNSFRASCFVLRISLLFAIATTFSTGCSRQPPVSQLSGKVTFKGQPVPAGYVSFTPDVESGNKGQLRVFQIKDGAYDSAQANPPGLPAGHYFIRIAGFDGKRIPYFGQGKQIFNEVTDLEHTVPEGSSEKDFVIPESAGQNVQIQRTADT